jgi:thiol-disulfide isomerase/thioredoxin
LRPLFKTDLIAIAMRFFLFILGLLFISCSEEINQEKINYEDEKILVGKVDWDGLTMDPYSEWFTPMYLNYQVDSASLAIVEPILPNIEIVMFLGSWCSDSHVQVPQFYKMLDHVGYDLENMTVYALERLEDTRLVSPKGEEEGYSVKFVPTIIFYKDGVELGRIVEYPRRTIEKDMAEILAGQ